MIAIVISLLEFKFLVNDWDCASNRTKLSEITKDESEVVLFYELLLKNFSMTKLNDKYVKGKHLFHD